MATQAQLDANRANSQKSTGPRTAEGRAAVRQNALKHGLTSMSPVAPGEDPAEFLQFLDRWTQSYLPVGPAEEEVLRTVVVASWRLRRIPAIEAGYYEMEQASDQAVSHAISLAFAHHQCAKQLEALSCQEARLQRTFDKSLRELERLQARPSRGPKTDLENQTQSSAQPEENQPSQAAATQPHAAPAVELENQTQLPEQPAEDAPTPVAQAGLPEDQNNDPENQTQFPAQSDESTASGPNTSRRAPRSLTQQDRQAASDLVARILAGLPKTA